MYILKSILHVINHPSNNKAFVQTLLKMFFWKFNQLFLRLPIITFLTQNVRIICYPDSSYGGYVFLTSFPEYNEMKFIEQFVKKGDTCIDVGANIGAISLLAASRGAEKVFAFEPTDVCIKRCKENIAINNFNQHIFVHGCIVSDSTKVQTFVVSKHSEVNALLAKDAPTQDTKRIRVPSTTLDIFCKEQNCARISLVKIDVEGAELRVLQGMKQLLSNHAVDAILFEWNARAHAFNYTFEDIVAFLKKYGYTLYTAQIDGGYKPLKIDTFDTSTTSNIIALYQLPKKTKK